MKNIGAFASSEEGGLRLNDSRHLGAFANGESVNMRLMKNKHLGAFAEGSQDWTGKPSDWSDIRKDCPDNSIALYAGHKSDYSQYDNLGFTATCVGGYKVYIDGNVYGSYASGSTCNITWSTSGITTGDDITTPSALKAHKIWIEPATNGENITAFHCARVAASGNESQGVLWAHFNLTNSIKIGSLFGEGNTYKNTLVEALTAKNNLITYTVSSSSGYGLSSAFLNCSSLEYLPVLKASSNQISTNTYAALVQVPAKKVVIKNNSGQEGFGILNQSQIEEIDTENGLAIRSNTGSDNDAHGATKLKKWPKTNENKYENFQMYNCPALEPVNIDDRFNDTRKVFRFYGTSTTPTPALKSLRVSNEAPFDGATPQIKVDYTNMDRTALVQLFNDLPTVSGGQIISIVGAVGSEDLTAEEVAIARNKGWTVTGGPSFAHTIVSGFSSSNYGVIPVSGIGNADTWDISLRAKTGNNVSNQGQYILSGNGAVYCDFGITNGYWNLFLSSNGYSWDISGNSGAGQNVAAKTNTEYLLNLSFTGTKYIFKVSEDNGITWTTVDEVTSSTKVYNVNSFKFGNSNDGYWPWGNWLDLTSLKIVFDGETVFDGEEDNNAPYYDAVGTLYYNGSNISNFTYYNYVLTKDTFNLSSADSWEIEFENNTGSIQTSVHNLLIGDNQSGNTNFVFGVTRYNHRYGLWIGNNGNFNINLGDNGIEGATTLSNNTTYKTKIQFTGTQYKVLIRQNDIDPWIEDSVINSSAKVGVNSVIRIGNWVGGPSNCFPGSIDFKTLKITIDNALVFDGATKFGDYAIIGSPTIETQYV